MNHAVLSVVFVVGERRGRIGRMLDALSRQTVSEGLEVVMVDATGRGLPSAPACPVKHVRTRPGTLPGRARYEGFLETSGGIVAFLEDHCRPESGWAEAILERHREPWDAVGYAFKNGSPDTYLYRSALLAEYGHWLFPQSGGPTGALPGCNVSYKRTVLEGVGERLGSLLEMDYNLHQVLLHGGAAFYNEPAAVVRHDCYERFCDLLASHFLFCRLQADRRSTAFQWSRQRRFLYGCLSPMLLPPLQVLRFVKSRFSASKLLGAILALPVMYAIYQFDAVGESVGCLGGPGDCAERFSRHELNAFRAGKSGAY